MTILVLARRVVLSISALALAACGSDPEPLARDDAGGDSASLEPCEVLELFTRARVSRKAVCDVVTGCYGAPPLGTQADCQIPETPRGGAVTIILPPAAPEGDVLDESECMCRELPDMFVKTVKCGEQADRNLNECLARCPADPTACSDEFVVACGPLKDELEAATKRGGACYRGDAG